MPSRKNAINLFINNMPESLKKKLKILYPKSWEGLLERINDITEEFKLSDPDLCRPGERMFSEKDIILIAYADHVCENKTKTFTAMKKFLDRYLSGLISTVHFLPFYPYSSDDGFSVIDYYAVNPPYGNWSDLATIGENFNFMFDCVANHCSVKSEWFRKFLAGDEYYSDFFIAFESPPDLGRVFRPRTSPLLTEFETKKGKRYVWTTFSPDQADLNFSNPEVFLEMVKIILFYLKNGAKAIRLDAIAYAWKKSRSACFDLPEVHTLVQAMRDIIRSVSPGTWIITETVLPHEENIRYFGNGKNEAQLVYNFVLETLLLHTFLKKDAGKAAGWINSWGNLDPDNAMLNLSASHDGIHVIPAKRVLSREEIEDIGQDCAKKGGQVLKRSTPEGEEPYEFNITYPSAIGDTKAFLASQAIQLALKGVPLIYLNNIIGADNWTEGVEKLGYARAINREKFDYRKLCGNLDKKGSRQNLIYQGYKHLLETRRNEPLFSPLAGQEAVEMDPRVLAIHRFDRNGSHLLALANVSPERAVLPAKRVNSVLNKPEAIDILSDKRYNLNNDIELEAFGIIWIK